MIYPINSLEKKKLLQNCACVTFYLLHLLLFTTKIKYNISYLNKNGKTLQRNCTEKIKQSYKNNSNLEIWSDGFPNAGNYPWVVKNFGCIILS